MRYFAEEAAGGKPPRGRHVVVGREGEREEEEGGTKKGKGIRTIEINKQTRPSMIERGWMRE